LGYAVPSNALDGTIVFNSASPFDFDNADGVTGYDFESLALHEIGHILGFRSTIEAITAGDPALSFYVMDMFRFGSTLPTDASEFTSYPRNLVPGTAQYFTDLSNTWELSNGVDAQASHWKDTNPYIGIMDPTLPAGTIRQVTSADVRMLDLLGYDPSVVPEPSTMFLLGSGLLGLVGLRRKLKK
jgi:hypothetical protein